MPPTTQLNVPPLTLDLPTTVRTWHMEDTPTPHTTSTSGTMKSRTTISPTPDSPRPPVTSPKLSGRTVFKLVVDGLPAALALLALITPTTWLASTTHTETSMVNTPARSLLLSAMSLLQSQVLPSFHEYD